MHIITKLGVGAIAAALLGACGSDSAKTTTTTTIKAATPTTIAAATTTITSSTATPTTVASGTSASDTVDLATMKVGKVLVDSEGRTLYLFTKDAQNKPGTCDAACATLWPPALASGTPKAGTGLAASKLTELKRADGTEQLAYNGWPLYRYSKDTKAGEDSGQAVGGTFYVVDATGNALK